jgi:hypothetical protein
MDSPAFPSYQQVASVSCYRYVPTSLEELDDDYRYCIDQIAILQAHRPSMSLTKIASPASQNGHQAPNTPLPPSRYRQASAFLLAWPDS